jgi:hypothetical protein
MEGIIKKTISVFIQVWGLFRYFEIKKYCLRNCLMMWNEKAG